MNWNTEIENKQIAVTLYQLIILKIYFKANWNASWMQ